MIKFIVLFVSSGPFKRDRKWVTGRYVLSQVNQEVDQQMAVKQLVRPPVCLRLIPYEVSLVCNLIICPFVNYSALFVVLRVVCEFEDIIISVFCM